MFGSDGQPIEGFELYPHPEWFGCKSPAMENALEGAFHEVLNGLNELLSKHTAFNREYPDAPQ